MPRVHRKSFDDEKAFKVVMGAMVAWIIFCLLVGIGIVYAAIHFIAKYW